MADISNIGSSLASGILPSARTVGDLASRRSADVSGASRAPGDRVEVSEVSRWLEEMNRLPAIREDKVAAARAAIANGTLDTDERLAVAVDRLIDEIA